MNENESPENYRGEESGEDPRDDGVLVVDTGLKEKIREAMTEHNRIDADRALLDAEKRECRKSLKAFGLNMKAFDAALRLARLEETAQREQWDESFEVCRSAMGVPLQADLFAETSTKH